MKTKSKISPAAIVAIIAITFISFANFFHLTIGDNIGFAGISIIIGIVAFFVVKMIEKQPFEGSGFDIRAIPKNLKDKKNWFWILSPILWGAITLPIELVFLPGAKEHILARAASLITYDTTLMTVIMLFVLALGEEIAMRSFLQNQLNRIMSVASAIIITSILFTVSHYAAGKVLYVSFDLISVFTLSVLYGIVFTKTKNGWICGLAHFLSNLFALIVYGII